MEWNNLSTLVIRVEEQITPVRWKRPRLYEGIYPQGRPPFDPYPYVTDVMSASFCPVAILHRLLHGVMGDPTSIAETEYGVGTLYHEFIAQIRTAVAQRNLDLANLGMVEREFVTFAEIRNASVRAQQDCLRYLREWSTRKLQDLAGISSGARMYFEVFVSEPYVRFEREKDGFSYPLRGKIDEIDIRNRRIIERTLRGGGGEPPGFESYQVWLLWKVLSSIKKSQYPEELANIDLQSFDLVVETPYEDFQIRKDNLEFERRTHTAFAWISDLAFDRRREGEAYRQRRCVSSCGLRSVCFKRCEPFPASKPVMHQDFRQMYRAHFWEQMWEDHLFEYSLLLLSSQDLMNRGLISSGTMIDIQNGHVELRLPSPQMDSMWADAGRSGRFTLLFGTTSIGHRIEAKIEARESDRLRLSAGRVGFPLSRNVLVLSPRFDVSVFEARPWFLERLIQSDLFRLEKMGRRSEPAARNDSMVQLLEGIFGTKVLRRERSGSRSD